MNIIWTNLALHHLKTSYEFIHQHSPKTAHEIFHRIETTITHLERYPQIGKKGRLQGTRELIIPNTPFLLIYRVKEIHIEILAFLHGRRKWP